MKVSTKSYRAMVLHIAAVLGCVVLFDGVAGLVFEQLFSRQRSGIDAGLTYAIESAEEQVVVLGSSRASHHYDPAIINNLTGKTCYNAGMDGQGLFFHESVAAAMMERYRPEVLVLDFNPRDLERSDEDYDRLATLLPYAANESIRQRLGRLNPALALKSWSGLLRYNAKLLPAIFHSFFSGHAQRRVGGYLPLYGQLDKNAKPGQASSRSCADLDPQLVETLERLLQFAARRQIDVVIVLSPSFNEPGRECESYQKMRFLAEAHDVPVWDLLEQVGLNNDPSKFKDGQHLNSDGATTFSRAVGRRLAEQVVGR